MLFRSSKCSIYVNAILIRCLDVDFLFLPTGENPKTFLRSRQQRGSSCVPVTVKPEPDLESAVKIPDPDSSPPIVVYEWRASPRTPSNDHDADVDIGQAVCGEEFTSDLDSSDARSPNSLSTEGQCQIPPEVVRRGRPRQLLPKEHQKLKPGPKSLKYVCTSIIFLYILIKLLIPFGF